MEIAWGVHLSKVLESGSVKSSNWSKNGIDLKKTQSWLTEGDSVCQDTINSCVSMIDYQQNFRSSKHEFLTFICPLRFIFLSFVTGAFFFFRLQFFLVVFLVNLLVPKYNPSHHWSPRVSAILAEKLDFGAILESSPIPWHSSVVGRLQCPLVRTEVLEDVIKGFMPELWHF